MGVEEGWPGVFPGDGDGAVEGGEDELSDSFGDEEEMDVAAIRRRHGRSKDGRRGGGEHRSKDIFKDFDREREVGHDRQRWDGSGSGRWSRLEKIGRMDQTFDVEEMAIRLEFDPPSLSFVDVLGKLDVQSTYRKPLRHAEGILRAV
jgi:hypothetical protein